MKLKLLAIIIALSTMLFAGSATKLETRKDGTVTGISGQTFVNIYDKRSTSIADDLGEATPQVLQTTLVLDVCKTKNIREVVDAGYNLIYIYHYKDGTIFINVDSCSRIKP